MREILSAEQPCILCGTALEVVTWTVDDDTGEERTERVPVGHSDVECRRMVLLYDEIWPQAARKV